MEKITPESAVEKVMSSLKLEGTKTKEVKKVLRMKWMKKIEKDLHEIFSQKIPKMRQIFLFRKMIAEQIQELVNLHPDMRKDMVIDNLVGNIEELLLQKRTKKEYSVWEIEGIPRFYSETRGTTPYSQKELLSFLRVHTVADQARNR